MKKHNKEPEYCFAHKYKIEPTKEQLVDLNKWGGATRSLSNYAKEERELRYLQNKNRSESARENITLRKQIDDLPEIKKMAGFEYLKEVPSQVLQQTLIDLDNAYQRFFNKQAKYPRWKSKNKDEIKLRFPDGKNIRIEYLNKIMQGY